MDFAERVINMDKKETMIKAKDLFYEYRKYDEEGRERELIKAVNGVNFQIEKGDFVAILGHNGSGKSTLAKHINALLVPSAGTLWVDGIDTKEEERVWDVRQSAGMVFQNPDNQIIGTIVEEDEMCIRDRDKEDCLQAFYHKMKGYSGQLNNCHQEHRSHQIAHPVVCHKEGHQKSNGGHQLHAGV